jgi:hypothetical protein
MQLHSDLFSEFGYDGELIEIHECSTQMLTVTWCEKCWTELSWVADEDRWVEVVYPGMNDPIE